MPYKDPEKKKVWRKLYDHTHRQQRLASARVWKRNHQEHIRKRTALYSQVHRQERALYNKKRLALIKSDVFKAYGGASCTCCGEQHFEFLTIDHIAGNGAAHRRLLLAHSIYPWLKKQGYPPGFRVLCFNCNCALGFSGYCPHGSLETEKGTSLVILSDKQREQPLQLVFPLLVGETATQ